MVLDSIVSASTIPLRRRMYAKRLATPPRLHQTVSVQSYLRYLLHFIAFLK